MITLLENWDKDPNPAITPPKKALSILKKNEEEDPIRIWATKINLTNIIDHDQFTNSTQFDIKETKTYFRAMQSLNNTK